MFELAHDEAYAGTHADVWQAIRFFNELKVVNPAELEPEDRACSICMQPYDDPEDENIIHVPVRLPCSHVFGKECLAQWTTPFGVWEDNLDGQWEEESGWFWSPFLESSHVADCPMCRRELFRKPQSVESAMGLEARLMLWDHAYKKVGCLRSKKEEQSRADLTRYVEFNRIANGDTIEKTKTALDRRWMELQNYIIPALDRLFIFAMRRRIERILTPTQARLNRNLENISECGLGIDLDDPFFEGYDETDILFHDDEDVDYDDLGRPRPLIHLNRRTRIWYVPRTLQESQWAFLELEELGLNVALSQA